MADEADAPDEAQVVRGALGAWWREGLRSALLMRPRWQALRAGPGIVAVLALVPLVLGLLMERLYIDGPASFIWPALGGGWLGLVLALWASWLLVPSPRERSDDRPDSAAALFAMLCAQALCVTLVCGLVFVPMLRGGFIATTVGRWMWWAAWGGLLAWCASAQLALVWRSGARRLAPRVGASLMLVAALALQAGLQPTRHWMPLRSAAAETAAPAPLELTQELLELQPQLLQSRLDAIGPGPAGAVNVYAITFAPYADEDVFQRESALVASVMQERFGAQGRTLQLVNHPTTVREWPWATPLNLQRAIARVAQVMDRDEDVLFIHLTSHGARSGRLAAEFWPLQVDELTPQMLRRWLDEAHIRYRVISISACYSGSWIEPLADDGTLVMTAADANHTSYGCGHGSTLTYFGRAMYDEQLRQTWSFERAHAAARRVIEQREREAGKSDGFSNPQIRVGAAIRSQLAQLEDERRDAVAGTSKP